MGNPGPLRSVPVAAIFAVNEFNARSGSVLSAFSTSEMQQCRVFINVSNVVNTESDPHVAVERCLGLLIGKAVRV